MGRLFTILGAVLLIAAAALYFHPLLGGEGTRKSKPYVPSLPVLPRVHPPLERSLLPGDEHMALAAVDLAARGEADAARRKIESVIVREGETAPRLAALALVELADGEIEKARAALLKAAGRSERSPLTLLVRARLRMMTRQFPAARRDLTALSKVRPGHPEIWRLLAVSCLGAGDAEDAFTAAEKAVDLAPGNRAVLKTMGACLLRLGREEESAIWLEAGSG